jgi:hypothetical protein
LGVPTDKEGWSFNCQNIQGIGIHNAEHHRNCTQRREPHRKLQKNKEMAVIIKKITISYMIESNKVFKLNQELWFGYTNLCEEQKTTLNNGVAETEL